MIPSRHPKVLLLGIDVGAYTTKGVLTDRDGRVVARHQVGHTVAFPRPGCAEQDADQVWWRDVVETIRALRACADD